MKLILKILAGIILLLVLGIAAIFILVDPNEFKPEIEKAALDYGNVELVLEGDIGLSIFPSIGLELGKTRITPAGDEQILANMGNMDIGVYLLPLLKGELAVSSLDLQDLEVNLSTDKEGNNNWDRLGPPAGEDTGTEVKDETEQATEDKGGVPAIFVPNLNISNANISYKNDQDGSVYNLNQFNLAGKDISLTDPFSIMTDFVFSDQTGLKTRVNLGTGVKLDLENEVYTVKGLKLDTDIEGVLPVKLPVAITLTSAMADMKADKASVDTLEVKAAKTSTTANVEVAQMTGKPVITGNLVVDEFSLNPVLKAIGQPPVETTDPKALQKISVTSNIGGPENSVLLKDLEIMLDDTRIVGKVGLLDIDKQSIKVNLFVDEINVDRYLPPAAPEAMQKETAASSNTDTKASAGKQQAASEELIPVEPLKSLTLDARLSINKLVVSEIPVENIKLESKAADGRLGISKLDGNVFDGNFTHVIVLDVSGKQPEINIDHKINKIQVEPIVTSLAGQKVFSGAITTRANLHLAGNNEDALMDSLKGPLNISFKNATYHGSNIEGLLRDGIRQYAGDFAMLVPAMSSKIPEELRDTTKLFDVRVKNEFGNSVAKTNLLQAKIDGGAITGAGFFDIKNEKFDYKINVVHSSIGNQEYLAGVAWPLECKGSLDGSAKDWCSVDGGGMKSELKKAAKRAAKQRLKDEAAKELGLESLEKEAVKEKAKEEVNKKVQEELMKRLPF